METDKVSLQHVPACAARPAMLLGVQHTHVLFVHGDRVLFVCGDQSFDKVPRNSISFLDSAYFQTEPHLCDASAYADFQ